MNNETYLVTKCSKEWNDFFILLYSYNLFVDINLL